MKTVAHIDELKLVLDIQQAHCKTCCHYEEDWDGENGEIWCGAYCHNKDRPNHEGISNLKSFPFEADQVCWEPEPWCASLPIEDISPEGELIELAGRFYVFVLTVIAIRHEEVVMEPTTAVCVGCGGTFPLEESDTPGALYACAGCAATMEP